MRRSLGILMLLAVVLLAAACGGGGGGSSAGKNVTCPTDATQSVTNGEFTICAYDIRFDVKTINATAGPITFTLVNKGAIPHTFQIEGQNFELKTSGHNDLKSGTITLAKGTYKYQCTIPGHAAAGMAGQIVVS